MEKEVEKTGKEFEAKCQRCPGLLAFNRQISNKKDAVVVLCRFAECIKGEK